MENLENLAYELSLYIFTSKENYLVEYYGRQLGQEEYLKELKNVPYPSYIEYFKKLLATKKI